MTYTQRILEQIGSSALEQARQEAEQITTDAAEQRDRELARYKDELYDRMYRDMQKRLAEIKRESLGARSRRQAQARGALFVRRRVLFDSVFSGVRKRLMDYAGTGEYRAALLEELRGLRGSYDHSASTVTLRAEDIDLTGEIREILPGCTVETGKGIELGGFTLRNEKAGIVIDETLDERLRMQKPWFLEHCGLKVV